MPPTALCLTCLIAWLAGWLGAAGGFFDGKTSADDRRRYLINLLAGDLPPGGGDGAPGAGGGSAEPGAVSDMELNRMVAGNDQELAQLQAAAGV